MKKECNNETLTIGGRIRKLRKDKHLTQARLAESLHLENKSSISKYENNKSTPSPETFEKMAEIFETTIDYILTGKESVRSLKIKRAEEILREIMTDSTLDAAIAMLLTMRNMEK